MTRNAFIIQLAEFWAHKYGPHWAEAQVTAEDIFEALMEFNISNTGIA